MIFFKNYNSFSRLNNLFVMLDSFFLDCEIKNNINPKMKTYKKDYKYIGNFFISRN